MRSSHLGVDRRKIGREVCAVCPLEDQQVLFAVLQAAAPSHTLFTHLHQLDLSHVTAVSFRTGLYLPEGLFAEIGCVPRLEI